MLVLSRKPGERLFIGEGVTLTILRVKGDCVRLGLEAPAHVKILRDEVAQRDEATGRQHSGDTVAGVATD